MLDGAPLDRIVRTDDHHVLALLIVSDGLLRNQNGVIFLADGSLYLCEQARQELAIRVLENAAKLKCSGSRVEGDGREVEKTLVRIAFIGCEPEEQGLRFAARLRPGILILPPLQDREQGPLVYGEISVGGLDLVDFREQGVFAGTHQISGIHQPAADAAVKRRVDLRIAKIEFGRFQGRLQRRHLGRLGIRLSQGLVHLLFADGAAASGLASAIRREFRLLEGRLRPGDVRFCLVDRRDVGGLLDLDQQIAFLD